MAKNTHEVKICEFCKQPYQRRETHSDASWQAKKYCERKCKDGAMALRYHENKQSEPKQMRKKIAVPKKDFLTQPW